MSRRRRRRPNTRFWATALGALGAGATLGAFIGWDAIGSIDPFYRFGRVEEWRPRFVNPAQGPPRAEPVLAAGPVWTAPPLIPAADPYDDVRLLGGMADVNIDRELRRLQRDIEADARRWSERLDAEFPARPEAAPPSPPGSAYPVAPASEPAAPAIFPADPPPSPSPPPPLAEI